MNEYSPIQTNQMPWYEKIIQRLWEVVRPIVFGCSPFFARKWRRTCLAFIAWIYRKGPSKISPRASLARTSRIDYPWHFEIGENSSIGERTWVYALADITIGKNCCLSDEVMLLTGTHDITSPHFDLITKPITIEDNVWIATRAIIMGGITIGEGAVIAAGAVVTKNVQPWTVVGGNPAKIIKERQLTALTECSNPPDNSME